ncbi:MAG: DUF3617 domain-containing protein [Erythrobacter sp.]
MKAMFYLAAAATLVAGCSDNSSADADGDGTITQEEVEARLENASDDMFRPQPGQYRVTTELANISIPGAPDEVVRAMSGAMTSTSTEYCMSEEDAERGFEKMAESSQSGDSCTYSKFDVESGSFSAVMACEQNGGTMNISIDGTGSETASEMALTMEGNMPGLGDGSMKLNVSHERIGDCN